MKKKTKKAAKPRPKTTKCGPIIHATIMAWSPNRVAVRRVAGSDLDIEMAVEMLVREVCPSTPECWQILNADAVVELRR